MERDIPRQNEGTGKPGAFGQQRREQVGQSIGFAQRPFPPSVPQNTNWRPNPLQHAMNPMRPLPPFDMSRAHGFHAPQAQPNLPSSYELAILQAQRNARDAEQLQLQRMGQYLDFPRRRSSMSEVGPLAMPNFEQAASERLRKRRRISSPPLVLSNQTGNSFPMPQLEGNGREIGVKSMKTFRQLWEKHAVRSKMLYPDDVDKQHEYIRWRFLSALGGRHPSNQR